MKDEASIELKQHSETAPGGPLLSPGVLLLQARHELGLTQIEVARRLCLSVKMIIAIERDEYKELHGLSYIRGYLRAYSNLINLSPDKVLHAFDQQGFVNNFGPSEVKASEPASQKIIINKENIIKRMSYLFIIALVVMSFLWWHEHRYHGENLISIIDMDISHLDNSAVTNPSKIILKPEMLKNTTNTDKVSLQEDDGFGKQYPFNSNNANVNNGK